MEVQACTISNFDPLSVNIGLEGTPDDFNQPLSQSKGSKMWLLPMDYKGQFSAKEATLEKLSDFDHVEHFLITFERIAVVCGWAKSDWAFRLIPLLTGKAQAAYVH